MEISNEIVIALLVLAGAGGMGSLGILGFIVYFKFNSLLFSSVIPSNLFHAFAILGWITRGLIRH